MRVLFFVSRPTPQRIPVFDALASLGVDSHVYYFSKGSGRRGWGPLELQHPHSFISSSGKYFAAMAHALNQGSAVCLYGYGRISLVVLARTLLARGCAVYLRCDTSLADESRRPHWRQALKGGVMRRLFEAGAEPISIGTSNTNYWQTLGANRVHLLPYSVPEPPLGRAQERSIDLLYVGRLSQEKGPDLLVQAIYKCDEHCPVGDAKTRIVGDGPMRSALAEKAGGDVRLIGSRPHRDLGELYRRSRVLVVPSRREGWGLVVNEARANGCLVVASTRVAAADDIVGSKDGVRFAAESIDGLHAALHTALSMEQPDSVVDPPAEISSRALARIVLRTPVGPRTA